MILINDATDGNVFIPEDVFEEIADLVLTNLQHHPIIGEGIEDVKIHRTEDYKKIVETSADIIHTGINEYVDANFLKSDEIVDTTTLSFGVARAELKNLFQRNMDNAASS